MLLDNPLRSPACWWVLALFVAVTVAVGQTTRFTVSVPANATPGPNHAVEIESWQSGASELFSVWDVQVVVQ